MAGATSTVSRAPKDAFSDKSPVASTKIRRSNINYIALMLFLSLSMQPLLENVICKASLACDLSVQQAALRAKQKKDVTVSCCICLGSTELIKQQSRGLRQRQEKEMLEAEKAVEKEARKKGEKPKPGKKADQKTPGTAVAVPAVVEKKRKSGEMAPTSAGSASAAPKAKPDAAVKAACAAARRKDAAKLAYQLLAELKIEDMDLPANLVTDNKVSCTLRPPESCTSAKCNINDVLYNYGFYVAKSIPQKEWPQEWQDTFKVLLFFGKHPCKMHAAWIHPCLSRAGGPAWRCYLALEG